jgi:hypothetical protein
MGGRRGGGVRHRRQTGGGAWLVRSCRWELTGPDGGELAGFARQLDQAMDVSLQARARRGYAPRRAAIKQLVNPAQANQAGTTVPLCGSITRKPQQPPAWPSVELLLQRQTGELRRAQRTDPPPPKATKASRACKGRAQSWGGRAAVVNPAQLAGAGVQLTACPGASAASAASSSRAHHAVAGDVQHHAASARWSPLNPQACRCYRRR